MTILAPLPKLAFRDNNNNAAVGALLFTYQAGGGTTKLTTYQDSSTSNPNTNPIQLDYRGECNCWLIQGQAYKFVLAAATDTDPPTNPFWTVDNINPAAILASANYAVDTGTANAYAFITAISAPAYVDGLRVSVKIANTNTGASTLNYNTLGIKNVVLQNGSALSGGELQAGGVYDFEYINPNFQLISSWIAATSVDYIRTAAEIAAGVTPVNYYQTPLDRRRYTSDADWNAVVNAVTGTALWPHNAGAICLTPTANYTVTADDWGRKFLNIGSAPANFMYIMTLPALTAVPDGFFVEVNAMLQKVQLNGAAGTEHFAYGPWPFDPLAANYPNLGDSVGTCTLESQCTYTIVKRNSKWYVSPHMYVHGVFDNTASGPILRPEDGTMPIYAKYTGAGETQGLPPSTSTSNFRGAIIYALANSEGIQLSSATDSLNGVTGNSIGTSNLTFTASVGGATSGTLTASPFAVTNGTYVFTFSNGNVRTVTVVGSACTWTGALTAGAVTMATTPSFAYVVQPGDAVWVCNSGLGRYYAIPLGSTAWRTTAQSGSFTLNYGYKHITLATGAGAGSVTWTLPTASTIPSDFQMEFVNTLGAAKSINVALFLGTDAINGTVGGTTTVANGSMLRVRCDGISNWYVG
jgi:hypothetical protein